MRLLGTLPGRLANIPFVAAPAWSIVLCCAKPSGASSLTGAVVGTEHRDLVLDDLRAVLLQQPREQQRVGPGGLHLLHQVGVALRLGIPLLDAGDLHAERASGALEGVGLALAGRVVGGDQDVRVPDALLVGEAWRGPPSAQRRSGRLGCSCACRTGSRRRARSACRWCPARSGRRRCCRARPSPGRRPGALLRIGISICGAAGVVGADHADHVGVARRRPAHWSGRRSRPTRRSRRGSRRRPGRRPRSGPPASPLRAIS